jgi:hypothetical protein
VSERQPTHTTLTPHQQTTVPAAQHVWVDTAQGREPGLLVMWERRADGWYGMCFFREQAGQTWDCVTRWLRSDRIEQVGHAWEAGPPA